MQKTPFPYRLFVALLLASSLATFFTANTVSVTKHSDQTKMITPFPIAIEAANQLQIVTAEQLVKLQLPDPETTTRLQPHFILGKQHFTGEIMTAKSILGTSITNGQSIHIPTNYSAQISGKTIDDSSQEITIIYSSGAQEDQLITAIYTAHSDEYIPNIQYVKNVLIWKSIFMNGMMISLILPFIICKWLVKKRTPQTEPAP